MSKTLAASSVQVREQQVSALVGGQERILQCVRAKGKAKDRSVEPEKWVLMAHEIQMG